MLKKLLITASLTFSICFGLVSPIAVYAAVDPIAPVCENGKAAQGSEFCKNVKEESSRSIIYGDKSLLGKILQTIIYITAAISVVLIVIGGFRYVLSAGDSNGVQGAKNTVMYAAIGLAVAIFAQTIVSFVLTKFLTI